MTWLSWKLHNAQERHYYKLDMQYITTDH